MGSSIVDINILAEDKDSVILDNQLELFFQEIAVILDKKISDFYGNPEIINLRKYVFAKNTSESEIKTNISNYVRLNCPSAIYFKWDVNVNFVKSLKNTDVIYIEFNVYSNGETYSNKFLIGT